MFIIIVFCLGSDKQSGLYFFSCQLYVFSYSRLSSYLLLLMNVLFHSAVPLLEHLGKHSSMSSLFPIAILKGTCVFSDRATTSAQCVFGEKKLKYIIKH